MAKKECLPEMESTLDRIISDIGHFPEFEDEYKLLFDALWKFQDKAKKVFPELKWNWE